MLYVDYAYSNKQFSVTPYTTNQEKDLLLLSTVGEENLNSALKICGHNNLIETLSQNEKLSFLYKLREISVGADVNVSFKCTHCGVSSENTVDIQHTVKEPKNKLKNVQDQFENVTTNNLHKFLGKCEDYVQEMDIDDCTKLLNDVRNSCCTFDFIRQTHCQKCAKPNFINIGKPGFCVNVLSEDSLVSLYQSYNDLIFFGKYSKVDVDTLYPFERTILTAMLNKTREELNNAT